MRRIRSAQTECRNHHQPRRGTAQIELALFLPVYATFVMILFTISSFARTRSEVAIAARYDAWQKRDLIGDQTQPLADESGLSANVGRVLNGEQDPTLGLVDADQKKDATLWLKSLNLLTNLQNRHFVLTDVWDYRTLPFAEQGSHARLTLDKRTAAFGRVDRGAFSSLAAFSGGSSAIGMNDIGAANQNTISSIRSDRTRLTQAINELSNRIARLRRRLDALRRADPVDTSAVLQTQRAIRSTEQERRTYQQQLQVLNIAQGFVS